MTQTAENLSRAAAAQVTAEAKQATLAFADYLRMNMSTLNTRELVPFSRELDHMRDMGLISTGRGKIYILDRGGLAAIAGE